MLVLKLELISPAICKLKFGPKANFQNVLEACLSFNFPFIIHIFVCIV